MKRIALFITFAGIACAAAGQTPIAVANTPNTADQHQVCIQHAGKLLEEVFVLLRKNYVNKDAFDLDGLSLEAKRKLEDYFLKLIKNFINKLFGYPRLPILYKNG